MGKGYIMKTGIILTGSGTILFSTSSDNFEDPEFVNALRQKGIDKYIAFEVPEEKLRKMYGQHYVITMADRKQFDLLRIVDVDGQRIFMNFDLAALSGPVLHDGHEQMRRAA
jgi:hypothetical protein